MFSISTTKKSFFRLLSTTATGAVLTTGLMAVGAAAPATAADFTFSANFGNGYSATGSFTTKNSAPTSFVETNPGTTAPFATQFLQSVSLSVFNGSTLLDSGSSVVNGISNDSFFHLSYNSLTNSISELDVSTVSSGNSPFYFISNGVNANNVPVPFGSVPYNLFSFAPATNGILIGSTSSVQTAAVPEPSEMLGTLALGAIGAGYLLKRQFKKAAI